MARETIPTTSFVAGYFAPSATFPPVLALRKEPGAYVPASKYGVSSSKPKRPTRAVSFVEAVTSTALWSWTAQCGTRLATQPLTHWLLPLMEISMPLKMPSLVFGTRERVSAFASNGGYPRMTFNLDVTDIYFLCGYLIQKFNEEFMICVDWDQCKNYQGRSLGLSGVSTEGNLNTLPVSSRSCSVGYS